MPWKIKADEEGKPVFQDEKPVYIDPDGKELTLDPPSMYEKILDLNKESKKHRETAKTLESKIVLFNDIEDLEEWKKQADTAIETVANFNDKDWMKAEKVEKLKKEMVDAHEAKQEQLRKEFEAKAEEFKAIVDKKNGQIRELMISSKFATSPLFSGSEPKTTLPPEIAETYFGKNFKVEEKEDGSLQLTAYYSNGDLVYSKENPGELAAFDEAMQYIFDKFPGKDKLLRAKPGSGAPPGGDDKKTGETDDIAELQKQHANATANGDIKRAIALKNRIHQLRMNQKAAA